MYKLLPVLLACSVFVVTFGKASAAPSTPSITATPVVTYPVRPLGACLIEDPILYNPCLKQDMILVDARAAATAQNKTVLIAYGADWCIWCHVFEAYARGDYGKFAHPFDGRIWKMSETPTKVMAAEAAALNRYIADNFVIAHISASAPDGDAILTLTGAKAHSSGGIPFIYSISVAGQFAAAVNSADVEIRRDTGRQFRGYDRSKLLQSLVSLRKAVVPQS
jgi:hypothetical protein